MKKIKRVLTLFMTAILLLGSMGSNAFAEGKKVEKGGKLVLSAEKVTLKQGETYQFTGTLISKDGSKQDVTNKLVLSTEKQNIIKAEQGKITALQGGKAILKASYLKYKASMDVTVVKKEKKKLVNIKASEKNIKFTAGDTKNVIITATYNDKTTEDITNSVKWTSDNINIVRVEGGRLFAVGKGNSKVNALYNNMKVSINVEVKKSKEKKLIRLKSNEQIEVKQGESFQSYVKAYYSDGTSEDVTKLAIWSTECSLFTVDGGNVTGVTGGNGVLKITYMNKSIYCNVQVQGITEKKLIGVTASAIDMDLTVGESRSFTVTALYDDNTSEDITSDCSFSLENQDIFKVENGSVIGLAEGTGVLKITYNDYNTDISIKVHN